MNTLFDLKLSLVHRAILVELVQKVALEDSLLEVQVASNMHFSSKETLLNHNVVPAMHLHLARRSMKTKIHH
jgi:hypothetical protein